MSRISAEDPNEDDEPIRSEFSGEEDDNLPWDEDEAGDYYNEEDNSEEEDNGLLPNGDDWGDYLDEYYEEEDNKF